MKTVFCYDRKVLFTKYGFLFLFLLVMFSFFLFTFGLPSGLGANGPIIYDVTILLFMAFPIFSIFLWIINLLNTKIYLEDDGFYYKSLIIKRSNKWEDISTIESKYYHSGSFPCGDIPKDLKIVFYNGRSIKVLYFLKKHTDKQNIYAVDELKALIEAKLNIIHTDSLSDRVGSNSSFSR